jgi:hypothetical protein
MEKYFGDILAGVIVLVIGAAVIGIVKATLASFVLDMQKVFVTKEICALQHKNDAEEREAIRKNSQNHEDRLNAAAI